MEISGKIIQKLQPQGGTSKAGNQWKKQEYVLETQETYPKKVCFHFFNDKVDQYPLNIGDDVTISFDVESREFNGRWYTDIRGFKAEKNGAATGGGAPIPPNNNAAAFPGDFPPAPADLTPTPGATDDLPF
ncbi:MAG: DUF3127 domain-containing protein [Muribaculaceae bacterium]|nr:DUF3127 domain-containing protein [Bacteroides sp.]MDE6032500.1 DUF3127 domain-containing protein [Muribaculaceae bacterium]MDE6262048.1 DUF3127 domain-containing protein [Muribaculaceae bacterium]MDE6427384.1 DUF3127 domain-containing protein [Muribaculaceae bacterium]